MGKDEILEKIKTVGTIQGRNSMGVAVSYYNPYYLVKKCFDVEELEQLTENELNNLIKLANYASEVFF